MKKIIKVKSSALNEDRLKDKIKTTMHRTHGKDFEAIVAGRLIFEAIKLKLDFDTQRYVRMQDGKVYMIDLYFPQINLAVECDEAHHLQQVSEDEVRQLGITAVTGADFIRVNAHDTGDALISETEAVITEMQNRKSSYKGNPVDDYDYNTKVENGRALEQKAAMLRLKKRLEEIEATGMFDNQLIRQGRYADALSILYDSFPFKNISIVHYPQKFVVAIEYDAQFDSIIQKNISEFLKINNVDKAYFAKNPYILRLDITQFVDENKNIDVAVQVASDARYKFLDLVGIEY